MNPWVIFYFEATGLPRGHRYPQKHSPELMSYKLLAFYSLVHFILTLTSGLHSELGYKFD